MASEKVEIRKLWKFEMELFAFALRQLNLNCLLLSFFQFFCFFETCLDFSKLQQLFNVRHATCMPIHQPCSVKMSHTAG